MVENVTVSEVAEADVTVPTAPLFMTTVLPPATVENPKPVMVTVAELIPRLVVRLVITGVTFAT